MKSTICLAEDRPSCEPCVKLLLLSLNLHWPRATVNLFYPPANDGFLKWISKFHQVHLRPDPIAEGSGWNVKPHALMLLMDQGFDEVIWLDSDIIVSRDVLHIFAGFGSHVLVATEDALGDQREDQDALRARLWGFPVGRVLPFVLNSGVLRVTKEHYPLLQRWRDILRSDIYQDFQRKPWNQRPVHMRGDQDVLSALLSSREFSEIPMSILRRGKHILQFNGVYGYTVAERMRNLLGDRPAFIHSFGGKPWSADWHLEPSTTLKDRLKKIYLDLSPYTVAARAFSPDVEGDTAWMEPHYGLSRIFRTLGMGRPELTGLPIAAFMDLLRILKLAS